MAAKFLDADGLSYVIRKIKALIDGKQDKLTFDDMPTAGRSNPVTSDGIYQAVNNGITISIEPSAGSETWIEVPTENLYVGGNEPTERHTLWLELH